MLADPAAGRVFGQTWEAEARRMVSLFRTTHDLWLGDTAFAHLVSRLFAGCAEFSEWWAARGVGAPVSGTKHLQRPMLGMVDCEYASFQANDDPALKLALYTRI